MGADAGGKAWMKEAFHIAYNIQGDATRDPKRDATPWANEQDIIFVNCVSLRNKMNYRLWGTAYLVNCLSANAFKRGGSWASAGFWSIGTVRALRLTVANNQMAQVYADSKAEHTADDRRLAD
jgi:hypothetical protein